MSMRRKVHLIQRYISAFEYVLMRGGRLGECCPVGSQTYLRARYNHTGKLYFNVRRDAGLQKLAIQAKVGVHVAVEVQQTTLTQRHDCAAGHHANGVAYPVHGVVVPRHVLNCRVQIGALPACRRFAERATSCSGSTCVTDDAPAVVVQVHCSRPHFPAHRACSRA